MYGTKPVKNTAVTGPLAGTAKAATTAATATATATNDAPKSYGEDTPMNVQHRTGGFWLPRWFQGYTAARSSQTALCDILRFL